MSFPEARVLQIAQVCHEANRAWCAVNGDDSQPAWADAPDWQKTSSIDGINFVINNPLAGDAGQHNSWMEQKKADGWVYGSVKDPIAKTHPCITLFHLLPPEQQAKDRMFVAIVKALSRV